MVDERAECMKFIHIEITMGSHFYREEMISRQGECSRVGNWTSRRVEMTQNTNCAS